VLEEVEEQLKLSVPSLSRIQVCMSRYGSSLDESVTGLEVVGLHCMHKNWKLRVGDF